MPGPMDPEHGDDVVRLLGDKHHTEGFSSLEEAQEYIRSEMQRLFGVPDRNVVLDPPYPWGGEIGDVMLVANWHKAGPDKTFREVNVAA